VAALYFDNLMLLDPVGAAGTPSVRTTSPATPFGSEDAGILEIVTPAKVLATYERPIAEAIRRDMVDREFWTCATPRAGPAAERWTLSLAKVRFWT
jgi:hypothetical protein